MGFFSRLSGGTTPHLADAMTVLAGDLVDVVGESYRHLLDGAEAEAASRLDSYLERSVGEGASRA